MAEDTSGIPDVDLGPVIDDLEASQDKDPPKDPPKVKTGEKPRNELGQFKTQEDLLKGYKEVQGFSTKVSQENKALQAEIAALKEQQELASFQKPAPAAQPRDFDDAWMESPESAIAEKVAEQLNLARIQDVLASEDEKDSASFNERYGYVNMLSQNPQYAHLSTTAQGVKKLFQIGDKLRKEQLKKSTGMALESFFGGPLNEEQATKFKALVMGKDANKSKTANTNAYMPDTSTSTNTGLDSESAQSYDAKINESVNKGDVDGTIDALFKGILAE